MSPRTNSAQPIPVMQRARCFTPPPTQEQVDRVNRIEEGTEPAPPAPKKIRRS
jgi:hypothetical protein